VNTHTHTHTNRFRQDVNTVLTVEAFCKTAHDKHALHKGTLVWLTNKTAPYKIAVNTGTFVEPTTGEKLQTNCATIFTFFKWLPSQRTNNTPRAPIHFSSIRHNIRQTKIQFAIIDWWRHLSLAGSVVKSTKELSIHRIQISSIHAPRTQRKRHNWRRWVSCLIHCFPSSTYPSGPLFLSNLTGRSV
jgi:hypothetical protein